MRGRVDTCCVVLAVLVLAVTDSTNAVTVTQTEGQRSASVTFEVKSGGFLEVTLRNTSGFDVAEPEDVLTAVFFDLAGDPTLTRVSGLLASGSVVQWANNNKEKALDGVIGGEWAYQTGLPWPALVVPFGFSGSTGGQSQGISCVGLDFFDKFHRFPGDDLQKPDAPNGLNYGLLSKGYGGAGNSAVTGQFPLIQNSVVFVLGGLPAGFDPETDVTNVEFQYGTDLFLIPEPVTMAGLVLGIGCLARYVRRRRVA